MSAGRPSKYSQEIADKICVLLATTHKSMKTICKEVDIDYQTHLNWMRAHQEYFDQYARAKEDQADLLIDEILEIADDSSGDEVTDEMGNSRMNSEFVQRSKIRIDSRKWVAAKLKPKKYGEKLDIEHTAKGAVPITQWIESHKQNEDAE